MSKKTKTIKNRLWVCYTFLVSWAIIVVLSFFESITYSGFIQNHIHIPLNFFLFETVALGLIWVIVDFERFQLNLFIKIEVAVTILFTFFWFTLKSIEEVNYPNYIYSNYHLNIEGLFNLIIPLLYILSLYVIVFLWRWLIKNKEIFSLKFVYHIFIIIVFVSVLTINLLKLPGVFSKEFLFMVSHPSATYDQKMEEELGKTFYDFITFVRSNTPPSSKILIPPYAAYPWPQSGNYVYMRYFLYPRELINGLEYTADHNLVKEKIDYALIDWGETLTTSGNYTHGWPKFDIAAKEIIYWNKNGDLNVSSGDYIYNNVKGRELWGLIKL